MDLIAYTVSARCPSPEVAQRFISWLQGGHVSEVCQAGALSGQVILHDLPPGEPPIVEVRYLFPDRAALARYLADHAPRLRAEGLKGFGPDSGVTFSRSTGGVAHTEANR
jgi:hypothetical protein